MGIYSDFVHPAESGQQLLLSTILKVVTSTGATNIVNVTGSGYLLGFGTWVTIAHSTSALIAKFQITIDGGTERDHALYIGTGGWDLAGIGPSKNTGNGQVVGDTLWVPLRLRYKTSLLVKFNVTTITTPNGTSQFTVLRGADIEMGRIFVEIRGGKCVAIFEDWKEEKPTATENDSTIIELTGKPDSEIPKPGDGYDPETGIVTPGPAPVLTVDELEADRLIEKGQSSWTTSDDKSAERLTRMATLKLMRGR